MEEKEKRRKGEKEKEKRKKKKTTISEIVAFKVLLLGEKEKRVKQGEKEILSKKLRKDKEMDKTC